MITGSGVAARAAAGFPWMLRAVTVLAASVLASPAVALTASYGALLSSTYTNNFLLSATDEQDEWSQALEGNLTLSEKTRLIDANVSGSAGYYVYTKDTLPNEGIYFLNGNSVFTLRPGRLTWTLEDSLGEEAISTLAAGSRRNRQRVNVLSTGPDLTFRLGQQNTMTMQGRWSRSTYSESDIDNTRLVGLASLGYAYTSWLTLSLNGGAMQVEFDDDVTNENFDRYDGFLLAQSRVSRTSIDIGGGITRVKPDVSDDANEWRASLSIVHRTSSSLTLGFTSVRQASDSTLSFISAAAGAGGASGSATSGTGTGTIVTSPSSPSDGTLSNSLTSAQAPVGDIFILLRHTLYGDYTAPDTRGRFTVYRESIDYETSPLDYDLTSASLRLTRTLTENWRGRFDASYNYTDYGDIDRTDKDTLVSFSADYVPARNMLVSLFGSWTRRNSDVGTQEYRAYTVGISLGYQK